MLVRFYFGIKKKRNVLEKPVTKFFEMKLVIGAGHKLVFGDTKL